MNPQNLGLLWVLPFAGMLASIALMPLLCPHFWEKKVIWVVGFWSLTFIVPFAVQFGIPELSEQLKHVILADYLPFIILLTTLYVITGGIHITGRFAGTPTFNLGFMAFASVMASFIGTTGAAMLFIRPFIRANGWRHHKTHTIIFFIILVANVGGSLTPIGDPPLFLGFLKGVGFGWLIVHMLPVFLVAACLILGIYFVVDSYLFRVDRDHKNEHAEDEPHLRIDGKKNITFLALVIGTVFLNGQIQTIPYAAIICNAILILLAYLSYVKTGHSIREMNHFSWAPMTEVALLFIGIFVTIIPAILILKAGRDGALSSLVNLTFHADGQPHNVMFFWLTGLLSSFLDNAPTYLVFFNLAGGDATQLMGPLATTLIAISAGAVFMGANSYIGNAPNMMVKAIAQHRGIKMPSFFGYVGWACAINIPVFIIVSVLFF